MYPFCAEEGKLCGDVWLKKSPYLIVDGKTSTESKYEKVDFNK